MAISLEKGFEAMPDLRESHFKFAYQCICFGWNIKSSTSFVFPKWILNRVFLPALSRQYFLSLKCFHFKIFKADYLNRNMEIPMGKIKWINIKHKHIHLR